jgi:hypothetical protein
LAGECTNVQPPSSPEDTGKMSPRFSGNHPLDYTISKYIMSNRPVTHILRETQTNFQFFPEGKENVTVKKTVT